MTVFDNQTGDGDGASRTTNGVLAGASLKDLVSRMSLDLSHLVRLEVELAKVEIKDEVARSGKAAGFLGGTAFAGYFVLSMLSFAAAFGLAEVMATGFAFLIVGLVYALVAGALYILGRKQLATVTLVPKRTIDTLKEDMSWLKQRIS